MNPHRAFALGSSMISAPTLFVIVRDRALEQFQLRFPVAQPINDGTGCRNQCLIAGQNQDQEEKNESA
jgi:hypothetical protein